MLADLRDKLADGAKPIVERMERAADTPRQRKTANHVYGIEGWGQARLRVALGAPLVLDVHRDYLLEPEMTPAEIGIAFRGRRAATVALVQELIDAGVDPATTVTHNGLGELSVAGWLSYLDQHAERESRYGLRKREANGPPKSTV
jgi:hypothetical protein